MFNIKITQFINPHLFYYQYEEDEGVPRSYDVDLKKILPLREDLLQSPVSYEPKLHEIVGHYNIVEDKWMRCQVDFITYTLGKREKTYIMFALDYGYSVESIGKWLAPLPESMKEKSKTIFLGGINNIVPCEYKMNPNTYRNEYNMGLNWNSGSILKMNNLIITCHELQFCPEIRLTDGHLFGKLLVKTLSLEEEDVAKILIKEKLAIESSQFMEDFPKIFTAKILRWQNNDRNAIEFRLSTKTHFPPMCSLSLEFPEYDLSEESDMSFLLTINESRTERKLRKLMERESHQYVKDSKNKVVVWQEQNEKFLNLSTAGESEIHKRGEAIIEQLKEFSLMAEPTIAPLKPSADSGNFPVMKKRTISRIDEDDDPKKIEMQNFLQSLQELCNVKEEPKKSSRQMTDHKPAGYIQYSLNV